MELQEVSKSTVELHIKEGPTKSDLQWAIAYPRHFRAHFDAAEDTVAVHVDTMKELPDGTTFLLTGHLMSGLYKDWPFRAIYDVASRAGTLNAKQPSPTQA
jgi:hypothetical protein